MFYLDGYLMTGSDPKYLVFTLVALNVPSVYFFASPLAVRVMEFIINIVLDCGAVRVCKFPAVFGDILRHDELLFA